MELFFAFAAGTLTLINPCVLPVLPIVLAGALNSSRFGPMALAAGMGVSFVVLGLTLAAAGQAIRIGGEVVEVSSIAAVLMIGFGLVMLVPQFSERFAVATAGVSSGADAAIGRIERAGWPGQFLGGLLLGAVWSPCVGPTLGGAISMASTGENLGQAAAIMIAFSGGVGAVVIGLSYGARNLLTQRRAAMMRIAQWAKPILGGTFVFVGVAILMRWHIAVEIWMLDHMPIWLQDLSVIL
ncbi:MAG: cytochrome c biogenesis CcdA family protein [Pseudomonadota bacterium]